MKKNKFFFFIISLSFLLLSCLYSAGLRFGMTRAVKAKVKELDKKVLEKRQEQAVAIATRRTGTVLITSVKQSATLSSIHKSSYKAGAMLIPPTTSFTVIPSTSPGWINSGAPDYIKVTLKEICVHVSSGTEEDFSIWSGTKVLNMDGSGIVDTSGMTFELPEGNISEITLIFSSTAQIKGTLTADFNISSYTFVSSSKTFYTKSEYAYNANSMTGGATSYTMFETGPAEETLVSLGKGGDNSISFPVTEVDSTTITILIDIDRMLRFYIGLNEISHGGVDPTDPADKSYFFCHTLFNSSVAAFFGAPGSIQGYRTEYASYDSSHVIVSTSTWSPWGVDGWMTLIYDSHGNFMAGNIVGDDDNALTVAKGNIISYDSVNSSFTYVIGNSSDSNSSAFTVYGFTKQTTLNSASPVATWEKTRYPIEDVFYHGEAIFTLLFK